MTVLAFDLGGTRLKAAAVDGDGSFELLTAPSSLDAVADLGQKLLGTAPCDKVGLCVPGIVEDGVVRTLPGKLAGVEGMDMRAWLASTFDLPVGAVVNDAVAFGWAEAAARPGRRVFTVTIGTGLGTVLVDVDGGDVRGLLTGQAWEATCRSGAVTFDRLVEALAAMCFAHEPDVVVLGGGGAPSLDGVEAAVNERLDPWLSVQVQPAATGDAGGVVGVALMSQ